MRNDNENRGLSPNISWRDATELGVEERGMRNDDGNRGLSLNIPLIVVVALLGPVATCFAEQPQESAVQCPSADFQDFLREFMKDEKVQRTFTRIPLKLRAIDFEAKPEPSMVTKIVERNELQFPVFPLKAERRARRLSQIVEDMTARSAKAVLYSSGTTFQLVYRFEKEKCWTLVMIDDQTYSKGDLIVSNWLDYLFPSVSQCTPRSFYYDTNRKRTNKGVLEKLKYAPYVVDSRVARYKVHESFFGLEVNEIAIPAGVDLFEITVKADSGRLAQAIRDRLGTLPRVLPRGAKPLNATAQVVSKNATESIFVCTTFEE